MLPHLEVTVSGIEEFSCRLDKLDESYEEAKEVITNTLRDISAKEQLAYQPHDPDSVIVS